VLAVVILAAGLATVAARRSAGSSSGPGRAAPPASEVPSAPTTATSVPPPSAGEPAYITRIKAQVADLRGLAWKSPLKVDVVSKAELARRVRAAIDRDRRPEREAGDGDTFKILHLIPADLNYSQTIDDLYSGLVLGFYDPKTKELVVGDAVGSDGSDVDGATKVTLAHELDHALTDQWFDFGSKQQALDDADREEEVDAFTALIEGDAKFLEGRYADADLSEEEQLAYALQGLGGGDTGDAVAKLAKTPSFLLRYLFFPYEEGLAFVKDQSGTTGDVNAGVNTAYQRPPTSTEQILHPEVYATGQRWDPPALPGVAAATGCEARRRSTLGEFKMGELLGAEMDTASAGAAARGWNGDVFETVRCGSGLGLVERWQSDSDDAAARLASALLAWGRGWAQSGPPAQGRFSGPGGTGRVIRTGSRVDLVLGADASTADRVASGAGA